MKKRNLIYVAALGASIMFSSCNDFLDTMPDSRTEVNNEKKITDILVSAYSQTYPIMFYELSSDNTMDSGAKYNPYWKSITQYYLWQDVSEVDDDDPNGIWQGCYSAISSANMALQAIEEMGDPVSLYWPIRSVCPTTHRQQIRIWESLIYLFPRQNQWNCLHAVQ